MRTAFIRTLETIAQEDERVWLVVGDLGYTVVETFRSRFPNRFVNAGVAEQNMTGLAAGLALSGKIVFTYSIANFPTLRCLEQIRNDVCYHNLNVKIVSVGGGFSYGTLGVSHYGTEDLAVLRTLPGMTVVAPGDPIEAAQATRAIAGQPGPSYLRLGKTGEPVLHSGDVNFELGKAIRLREGRDLTLISTGAMLATTDQVAKLLAQEGIAARVLSMHTLKPLDEEALRAAAMETPAIITIEEHSVIGGLGGAVAEWLAESGNARVIFKRIGIPSAYSSQIGNQAYMRSLYSLTQDGLLGTVMSVLGTVRSGR